MHSLCAQDVEPDEGAPYIKEVRAYVIGTKELEEKSGGGADCHAQAKGHWIVDTPIANPMSYYLKYKASRTSWGIGVLGSIVVEVELDNGLVGVGISSECALALAAVAAAVLLVSPTMRSLAALRCVAAQSAASLPATSWSSI